MPRVWLVGLAALCLGCTQVDEASTTSATSDATHCQLVSHNEAVAEAALAYFRKEVGELSIKAGIDRIERCAGRWNVLISGSTEDHPLPRLWYVGLTDPELKPVAFVPPE